MESRKTSKLMLPVLFVAAFAGAYNAQCVSVAIGAIAEATGVGLGDAQWLVSGYMLVQAIVMLYASLGVIGVFLGDLLMCLFDPRISLVGKGDAR